MNEIQLTAAETKELLNLIYKEIGQDNIKLLSNTPLTSALDKLLKFS